ncbi:MAG: pyruvate dehydrogenase (acetyl-transferring) E1 component subunit alpha [Chthonomonadales bacterium]|nr:pyruvate dehydrogenase (acetyl-transferring) E1 component subunit alpha [Chthonomonadales bacterium]
MTQQAVAVPPNEPEVRSRAFDLPRMYELMLLIRRFEESLYRKYREGKIGGYLHRYDGQEALVAGVVPLLEPGDLVLSTYRDHAHALAVGTPPGEIMAELMGRATGCAGGKGGSMHLIDPSRGFLGGDGIVGGPVPVSVGVGFALKYRAEQRICVCYFGDGAMNQGGVHEALNMAGLYSLPILFILENNGYAMGTAVHRSTAQPDMLLKARAHGVDARRVDGMDPIAVLEQAETALEEIRRTGAPIFMEMTCYRFVGHGVADNAQQQQFYRSTEEIEEWKSRDPVEALKNHLLGSGDLDTERIEAMERTIADQITAAIEFAESSPAPLPDTLYEHVFAKG